MVSIPRSVRCCVRNHTRLRLARPPHHAVDTRPGRFGVVNAALGVASDRRQSMPPSQQLQHHIMAQGALFAALRRLVHRGMETASSVPIEFGARLEGVWNRAEVFMQPSICLSRASPSVVPASPTHHLAHLTVVWLRRNVADGVEVFTASPPPLAAETGWRKAASAAAKHFSLWSPWGCAKVKRCRDYMPLTGLTVPRPNEPTRRAAIPRDDKTIAAILARNSVFLCSCMCALPRGIGCTPHVGP